MASPFGLIDLVTKGYIYSAICVSYNPNKYRCDSHRQKHFPVQL